MESLRQPVFSWATADVCLTVKNTLRRAAVSLLLESTLSFPTVVNYVRATSHLARRKGKFFVLRKTPNATMSREWAFAIK